MSNSLRHVCLVLTILMINGCSQQRNIKPDLADGILDLAVYKQFELTGKMSFSDGQEGGSGRIVWSAHEDMISATLKAPFGSKSWKIMETKSGSQLVDERGEVFYGESTGVLLSHQLGWVIPWAQLKDWVQGKPHDSDQAEVIWTDGAFSIVEGGWRIDYQKLKSYPAGFLPHKMTARHQAYSIKLVVKQWNW